MKAISTELKGHKQRKCLTYVNDQNSDLVAMFQSYSIGVPNLAAILDLLLFNELLTDSSLTELELNF